MNPIIIAVAKIGEAGPVGRYAGDGVPCGDDHAFAVVSPGCNKVAAVMLS
ncbi:hypothetical protein [Nocardia sp. NPDC047654]